MIIRRHYFVLSTNYSSAPIRDVHNVREYLLQLCRKKISLFALNCHRLPSLRLGTTYFTGGKAGVAWRLKSNSLGCHDGELHRMDCVFIPIEGNQFISYYTFDLYCMLSLTKMSNIGDDRTGSYFGQTHRAWSYPYGWTWPRPNFNTAIDYQRIYDRRWWIF